MQVASVFFLAAGFGTRLRPLTDEVPKALVPVGNRPQLLRLAERYEDFPRVANAHHHQEQLAQAVAEWRRTRGLELSLSHEDEVLGTAGGVRAARARFAPGPVLVHNADIEVHPEAVRAAFVTLDPRAAATLLVGQDKKVGVGRVGLDATRRVVRLREACLKDAEEVVSCEYLGVAVLAEACLAVLPAQGCLVGDVWIPLLGEGAVLRAVSAEAALLAERSFFDLGTPASYLAANLRWLDDAELLVRAERGACVHPDAQLALVGEGAQLLAPAQRVVLWPGARLSEPLSDAIVTPRQCVRVG